MEDYLEGFYYSASRGAMPTGDMDPTHLVNSYTKAVIALVEAKRIDHPNAEEGSELNHNVMELKKELFQRLENEA